MSKKIVIIYAHPNFKTSRLNQALIKSAEQVKNQNSNLSISNLYEKYPDGKIDISAEQELLKTHDLFILQFPFYWFNTTPLLKQWIDEVFTYGFAYGPGGDFLHGKELMVCITTGGNLERYKNDPGFTLPELLKPFEYSAKYCNMIYKPPFVVAGADMSEENLDQAAQDYAKFLKAYLEEGCQAFKNAYPKF